MAVNTSTPLTLNRLLSPMPFLPFSSMVFCFGTIPIACSSVVTNTHVLRS